MTVVVIRELVIMCLVHCNACCQLYKTSVILFVGLDC